MSSKFWIRVLNISRVVASYRAKSQFHDFFPTLEGGGDNSKKNHVFLAGLIFAGS